MAVVPLALRRAPLEVLATLAREPGAFLLEVPDETRPFVLLGCAPVAELRVPDGATRDPPAAIERFVADTPLVDPALPLPPGGAPVRCLRHRLGLLIWPPG